MIVYMDKKMTPTQFAKAIVMDRGRVAYEFWGEDCCLDYDKVTEREKELIGNAIARQLDRVSKLLGVAW